MLAGSSLGLVLISALESVEPLAALYILLSNFSVRFNFAVCIAMKYVVTMHRQSMLNLT